MSLHSSRTRIAGLSRELTRTWQETQESWRDSKAKEFDATYMQELFSTVDNAVTAMEDLDKMLKKLKEDCEL